RPLAGEHRQGGAGVRRVGGGEVVHAAGEQVDGVGRVVVRVHRVEEADQLVHRQGRSGGRIDGGGEHGRGEPVFEPEQPGQPGEASRATRFHKRARVGGAG